MALGDVIKRLAVSLSLETVAFEKGATLAEKRAAAMQRKFAKLGQNLTGVGQTMSLALTAPLTAFGVSAFQAASDAAELQSAFNQTFGTLAADMTAWAEATGNAMGRSTQSMMELANTFGIFFNQAAPTRDEAAKMSQTFAVLAQDLSSFYNVTESEALAKLRSGLAGESEPLRDFGVFLSEAAVQSKALELGLTGINNPLTEQEKIMARYAIILEQTKNAQGDVARTSDGTANQLRKAQAAFAELQVVVGTKLLPALTPLIEKLGAALEWFTGLPAPVQDTVLVIAGLAAALGPVLIGVGQIVAIAPSVVSAFTAIRTAALLLMANPVILGFAAVVAGIVAVWYYWDDIVPIVRNVYNGVKLYLMDRLGEVFNWVRQKLAAVTGFFKDMYVAVVGNSYVPDMVDGIDREFARLQGIMVAPAQKATSAVTEATRQMAQDVTSLLDRLFPEFAKARKLSEELALIDAAGLNPELRSRARMRLLTEGAGKAKVSDGLLQTGPLDTLGSKLEETTAALTGLGTAAKVQTVQIAESFRDMAQNSIRALDDLVSSIEGGGFLDILGSAVNLFLQLGSTGLFGKSIAANINRPRVPGFALGTNYAPGGLAMVGERGPELVNLPKGSQVITNRALRAANDAGGRLDVRVGIDPRNGNVTAYVDSRVAGASPAIMEGSAQVTTARLAQRQTRRIGGR